MNPSLSTHGRGLALENGLGNLESRSTPVDNEGGMDPPGLFPARKGGLKGANDGRARWTI